MKPENLSRRKLIKGAGLALGAAAIPSVSAQNAHLETVLFENVKSFGAKGDGVTDDTKAFQRALDAAVTINCSTVFVPGGKYLIKGSLNVPPGVCLKGVWNSVPAHNGIRDAGLPKPTDDGTTLLAVGFKGQEDGAPFITLNTNSTLCGVCIYYPEQKTDDVPVPYPYAVAMRGKNPAILDVELLNPYKGIDATQNERHLIRNISGQPLRLGVMVDAIYDIGRIENVHFNPWFSMQPKLFQWQMENGEAFVFGRTDWQYVLNTFVFGYKVGYRFIKSKNGVCNGNFLGIGADDCYTAMVVEDCAPMGLLITNGEFVSFHGPDPTMVEVKETNTGAVRFSNCAFWGPCEQIAKLDGGTVGFDGCTFVQWDRNNKGKHAIQASKGSLVVQGCDFQEAKPQVAIGVGIGRAVVAGNLIRGALKIDGPQKKSIQIENNASDEL